MDTVTQPSPNLDFEVTNPFTTSIRVERRHVDQLGHVNNRVYLDWIEQVSVQATEAMGLTIRDFLKLGAVYIVQRHIIEYLGQGREGDEIIAATWPSFRTRRNQVRRYRFKRKSDGRLLVRAETLWAYVDLKTGKTREFDDLIWEKFAPMDEKRPLRVSEDEG